VHQKKALIDQNLKTHVMKEAAIVGKLPQSPFIAALLATFSDKHTLCSVHSNLIAGPLVDMLPANALATTGAEGEALVKFIIAGLLKAVLALHTAEVVCRMIHPEVLMLDWKGYPVIFDLTLCKSLRDGVTYTLCGIPEYNAPEQISKAGYAYGPDYWAVGVLMFELFKGYPPWHQLVADKKGKAVEDCTFEAVEIYKAITDYKPVGSNELPYPQNLSKPAIDLMDDLIDPECSSRLGCRGDDVQNLADIEQHEFFDGFNWSNLEDGSFPSPIATKCKSKAATALNGKKIEFDKNMDLPKGDQKWCADWDFIETAGYEVAGGN